MDRRIVGGSLAWVAAVALVAAPLAEVLTVTDLRPVDGVLHGFAAFVAGAIPVTGAVLIARRRPEGVAVLVTAGLVALPAIASVGYFLVSASVSASSGSGSQVAMTGLYLVAQVSLAAAGAAAWGLRDAERWRWNRPVPPVFVAVAILALVPTVANLVMTHGVFFPVSMLVSGNVLDVVMLAQALLVVALLVLAARLPHRTAAVLLLVLLVPRLYGSIAQAVQGFTGFGMERGPLDWLGTAAEAALVATACWWLTRGDRTPMATEPAPHDGSATG